MWSYACMNQLTKEDLEKEATLDEQQVSKKNKNQQVSEIKKRGDARRAAGKYSLVSNRRY